MSSPAHSSFTKGRYAGVMTGTSLDGIDVAIIQVQPSGGMTLLGSQSFPFEPALAQALMRLQAPNDNELFESAITANRYADAVSSAILSTLQPLGLKPQDIDAAGVHGQTLRHRPDLGFSIQLNAPARIAEATGITVVSDFRSRDLAAGGQGAPLVPAFHRIMVDSGKELKLTSKSQSSAEAVVNIGGIANISWLGSQTLGFDCGPGNMLMDLWIRQHQGLDFDQDGSWGRQGQLQEPLLKVMLSEPFFHQSPPKSTGRDLFSESWLNDCLARAGCAKTAPQNIQATLRVLTAQAIAQELHRLEMTTHETLKNVWVCGGGARNKALMEEIHWQTQHQLGRPIVVASTQTMGWDPQLIEACAFAWLAAQTMHGLSGNLPAVTGARGERVLGSITPAARPPTPANA